MTATTTGNDVDVLILRLDAPLLSFGGVAVDEKRPTRDFPARSMLTGLLANALGWRHGDFDRLDRLQERLIYAARLDQPGELMKDFHTVDLGQDFMRGGWTTRDRPETRGGASGGGTHIRDRHFLAGALSTVALRLEPAEEEPTLEDLWQALQKPARPLFLGRKACLPSRPLVNGDREDDIHKGRSVAEVLRTLPAWEKRAEENCRVWWPDGEDAGAPTSERRFPVTDERDWTNQIHVSRRFLHQASVDVTASGAPEGEEVPHGG